jgi:prepilin-type N-terminal cleavage/methylation domain-containing protein
VRRVRQRGFSLLEVLSAISLFALIAAAVASMAMSSMRQTIWNRHATAAAMLAQEEVEFLRGENYDTIDGRSAVVSVEGQDYSISTIVVRDAPAQRMSHITVRIDWTGPEGSRMYEIETILAPVNTNFTV